MKRIILIVLGVVAFVAIGYGFFKHDIKGNDPSYFVSFIAVLLSTLIQIWPRKKNGKKDHYTTPQL